MKNVKVRTGALDVVVEDMMRKMTIESCEAFPSTQTTSLYRFLIHRTDKNDAIKENIKP
jgi:hypothetical protein